MNALVPKTKQATRSTAGLARGGPEECVFCRHVQGPSRRLHYLASQVKFYYGSCSLSYIRRREKLELQRLKSPDGTKHAFVKVHLHYTDQISSPVLPISLSAGFLMVGQ